MKHVNFEIAKKLFEMNANIRPVHSFYMKDGTFTTIGVDHKVDVRQRVFPRPSLNEVCEWLREVHEIHINIDPTLDWSRWHATIHDKGLKMWSKCGSAETHDDAVLLAITRTLDIVKDKKEGK